MRSQYRKPYEPRPPRADATCNTINKFAQGITDTYALGLLAEAPGLGIPVVVLPFVDTAFASRAPFRRSVESLRAEGIPILLGPGQFEPHPPGTGGDILDAYPWTLDPTAASADRPPTNASSRSPGPRRKRSLPVTHPLTFPTSIRHTV